VELKDKPDLVPQKTQQVSLAINLDTVD